MDFMAMLREERRKAGLVAAAGSSKVSDRAVEVTAASKSKEERAAADPKPTETVPIDFPPFKHTVLAGATNAVLARDGLEAFRVHAASGLRDVWYIPNFCTVEEHDDMLEQTYSKAASWKDIRSRRLQCYREPEMPPWLDTLASSLVQAGIFSPAQRPNHALLNEYEPGQGILGHTDGPVYHSLVACISLGSPATFRFTERLLTDEIGVREARELATLLLQPRSLVVFAADAYREALHSVPALLEEVVSADVANIEAAQASVGDRIPRTTRVSITMRTEVVAPSPK
ncbi:Alpha-ketoglutarate-dependent dioxygenase alkB-like 6 [Hondaea fermentalgiana]|uniref:Alpha-ketoglutarate-dependent dioxygenase alkB-like 6 n=1 Tax=Hondaea fermentalgiana TaxID=2315210 RepID=A0A2R5GWX9_9STRA|nr:Alpha-ketoglutarate-dependent dioxygenase alkB-like 6 [Hondaea fermentalgiana]|eukprot:GBG32444.1 Alpha-ketoglutarate-dependent dioxygenase alkB-like 6 [Hondaea fermentalgiana]